ncbi:MAG: GNAT family N-acetyltransferase [Paludibacteraceae bacterium]|nr:GNAT family N-acetyltransferase [Paludibacteraceae bacterium]
MKILYLRHNQIDRIKWDATIAQSLCDLPYAYSWYLDVVCSMWEALVTEDYAYVMPLPLKKKWGISYLIHPIWVQQLGVFSAHEVTSEIFESFRRRIPYLVYDFNVNYLNRDIARYAKINLIIPHSKDIATIRKEFNSNTRRNISKAQKAGLTIREVKIEEFVSLWKSENTTMRWDLHSTIQPLVEAAFSQFSNFNSQFKPHLFGVYKDDKLIASLFGMQTRGRFIYLIPVSNREGKECSAMFMLVDYILENICCPQGLTFDCEGSMIEGVARFYRGFGAVEQPYAQISRCRPQWVVKLLHR